MSYVRPSDVHTGVNKHISSGRNKKPTGRTEPNRSIPEPAGTGRGDEPNRTGPSHDASEKRRPNRVEPENLKFPNRTEPINFRTVRNRNEPNRFLHVFRVFIHSYYLLIVISSTAMTAHVKRPRSA